MPFARCDGCAHYYATAGAAAEPLSCPRCHQSLRWVDRQVAVDDLRQAQRAFRFGSHADAAGLGLHQTGMNREDRRQSRRATRDAASMRALSLLAQARGRLRRVLVRLQRYPHDSRLRQLRRIARFRVAELHTFIAALDSEALRYETGKTSLLIQGRRGARGVRQLEEV
jgi:hypothetical protein